MKSEISQEDLKTLSCIGNALWTDPTYACNSSSDTLAAASLMKLNPERMVEKAAKALIEKAKVEGMARNTRRNLEFIIKPFFRLSPEERFIIVSLHIGHWTYSRLSKILQIDVEEIQKLAWNARIQTCPTAHYPAGPTTPGPRCPLYDSQMPWTQKFIDDEISSKRELFFLQNHLMGCASCSKALSRCRDFYFTVDKEVHSLTNKHQFLSSFERVLSQSPYIGFPSERSFRESLQIFFRKKDIQILTAALFGLGVAKILYGLFS